MDRISVSLNAHNKPIYNRVCKPTFEDAHESVLEFVEKARTEFDLEITAVTVPEVDVLKVQEMAKKMGVRFRIRRLIPCFW